MSRRCQVTGREPSFGNRVSHSQRHTRRRWDPNIQTKRFWVPSQDRWVKLRVSTTAIKTIDRDGIEAVLARLRRSGERV